MEKKKETEKGKKFFDINDEERFESERRINRARAWKRPPKKSSSKKKNNKK